MTQHQTICFDGDLDFGKTAMIRADLQQALGAADRLTLDLSQVDKLSSAIVAVLVDMQQRAQQLGKALELGPVSDGAARVLHLFRLDTLFPATGREHG